MHTQKKLHLIISIQSSSQIDIQTYHNTLQFQRVQWALHICWLPNLSFLISLIRYLAPVFSYQLLSWVFGHQYMSHRLLPVPLLQTTILWRGSQTTYLPMLCLTCLTWRMIHHAKSELICILYFYVNKTIVKLVFISVHLPTKLSCVLMLKLAWHK